MPLYQQHLYPVLRKLIDPDEVGKKILQEKEQHGQQAQPTGEAGPAREILALSKHFPIDKGGGKRATRAEQAEQPVVEYIYARLPANIDGQIPGQFRFVERIVQPGKQARA